LVLGDDADRIMIKGYSPDLPARPEVIYFFDSDFPEIVPHGFAPNMRSWIADREHNSEADAFQFSETHPDQIPQTGTLEITDAGATVYLRYTRSVAKLIERPGRTTIFQYVFLCGAVTTNNPTIT